MKKLCSVLFCLLLAMPVTAQQVEIGGETLFRVDNPKLASAISQRIEDLMLKGADPSALKLVPVKNGVAIYWGKLEIVVVTKELAKANDSDPKALAAAWLDALRQVAAQGMLRLSPGRLEMPVGGESTVQVAGLAKGQFFFEESSGRVQLFEEPGGGLRVVAKSVGKTKVTVQRGKARATLFVHVKDLAGRVPDTVRVRVTGEPAPGELVMEALLRSLQAQSKVNPGCRLEVEFPREYNDQLPSIPQGKQLTLSAIARISGSEDYYPVRKEVRVAAESLALEPAEPNLLLVSNRPEQVDKDGVLLEYSLTPKEPSRLMYSHMNASSGPRNLWVNLMNASNEPAEVLVDWTFSGPSRSEVQVGHMAAQRFLQRLGAQAGYVLEIPPRSRLELAEHSVGRKELLSGFAAFRMLKGEKLTVQVLSKLAPGRNDGTQIVHLGAPFNPFKIHPHGVFAQPYFEEWVEYASGSSPLTLTYGESPWLIDFESGLPNTGNFGVVYRWHVTLSNPTGRNSRVGLFFTPQNGPAALSLLLGKEVISAPFAQRNQEVPVRSFNLGPRQEVNLDLTTLPEASSSYPARLEFREMQAGESMPGDYR
jgi:hypothetical protein